MRSLKLGFIVLASTSLLFLGACSNQASDSSNTNGSTTETVSKTDAASHNSKSNGGQVVESGKYHLELVPEKEANATHLDLFLQTGDKHETVPNANVTADIQSPDGTQKTVPFTYDASGKHYTAMLENGAVGQYQVKVTADVGSEKVNGRFNFNQ
ncbi:hypothetical protein [Rivularia sp. UHCC 0363]|uniref:hypothetical protein n=1 Tax=Rivularia sp. UHCC 0363 TaxID=3110244 RepID=UPI002B20A145|nr:hypothetical protein [Rivularia sp. UHCC 0363]MEA5594092.1 hypothetical protein [Rivularia sp. UHCC 0363]